MFSCHFFFSCFFLFLTLRSCWRKWKEQLNWNTDVSWPSTNAGKAGEKAAPSSCRLNPALQVAQSRPREVKTLPRRVTEADRRGFCAEGKREKPLITSTKGKDPFILKTPERGSEAQHAPLSLLIWNTKTLHEHDSEGEVEMWSKLWKKIIIAQSESLNSFWASSNYSVL